MSFHHGNPESISFDLGQLGSNITFNHITKVAYINYRQKRLLILESQDNNFFSEIGIYRNGTFVIHQGKPLSMYPQNSWRIIEENEQKEAEESGNETPLVRAIHEITRKQDD